MNASSTHHNGSASVVLDRHMSIQAAAEHSGYNTQYLRRLARSGQLEGIKIGQMWLVEIASLDAYLKSVQKRADRRYGPRVYQDYISE